MLSVVATDPVPCVQPFFTENVDLYSRIRRVSLPSNLSLGLGDQRFRVVGDPIGEDHLDIVNVLDPLRRVTPDDQQVGLLAHSDASGTSLDAEKGGAVQSGNSNGFQWLEAYRHHVSNRFVVRDARDDRATATSGVRAKHDSAASTSEGQEQLSTKLGCRHRGSLACREPADIAITGGRIEQLAGNA